MPNQSYQEGAQLDGGTTWHNLSGGKVSYIHLKMCEPLFLKHTQALNK